MNNTRKRGASAGLLAGSGLLALGLLVGLLVPATAAAQQTTPAPAQTSKTTVPATTTPLRSGNVTTTTAPATTTAVPTTTVAATTPAQNCDPKRDLSGSLAGAQGTISNRSANCSYRVGMASYMRFDEVIDHQKFYRGVSDEIKPAQTMTLSVGLADCSTQIDLFFGDLLTSLNGQRYDTRLLSWADTGGPFCVVSPETTAPATTAVPTTPPVTTVAPTTPPVTTAAPTTPPVTTVAPTTAAPTTAAPTTAVPTTSAPVTTAPVTTVAPTTSAPVTTAPATTTATTTSPPVTTAAPATTAPATSAPATAAPATVQPVASTVAAASAVPTTTVARNISPATTVASDNSGIVPIVEGASTGPEDAQSGTPAPVVLGESQAPIIPSAMPATGAGGTATPDLETYLLFGAVGLLILTTLGLVALRRKEMQD